MLDRLMKDAQQAEVFEIESEATEIGFEANQLRSFSVNETRGVAVRVMVDGRLGFAATSDMEATEQLVENALESARHGEILDLEFPAQAAGPEVQVYDPEIVSLSTSRLIEIGRELIEMIRQAEPEAQVKMDLERSVRKTRVRNSSAAQTEVQVSPFSISVMVERVQFDDVLVIFDYFNTATLTENYRRVAERVSENLRLAKSTVELKSGRMPVVLSPSGATVIAFPLMLGLNGKNVYRGVSPMAGKVGEKLFSERLTVVDDATLAGRPGSGSHDDEGVPRQRTVMVDRGTLQGFLYDLKTAAQARVQSTGNGERSLFSPPAPSLSNMVIEAGGAPLAEMIAGIEEGLLVESPLGLGQGNVISGSFSNNLSLAFKIEKGEIVGKVKNVSIAGNIYQDLKNVEAISRESEWVYGGLSMPYILLSSLNVVTKGN